MNAAAGLASAWVVFFPLPLRFALATAVALPALALAMVGRHKDALRLVGKDQGVLPDVFLAFTIPIFALAVRVKIEWSVLSWDEFWLPFIAVAGATFWISRSSTPQDQQPRSLLIFAMCSALYSYGSILSLNHIFDPGGLIEYESQVLGKRVTGVRTPTYIIRLGPFGPQPETELQVSRKTYDAYDLGDAVTIRLGQGALDIPYYAIQ